MAENSRKNVSMSYVKLTKDQNAPVEEIRPGELNQALDVPQLVVHKCQECGQSLPENYEPPADEPWTTGICGCAEDLDSCCLGLFCPCVLFGRNIENMRSDISWVQPCTCHAICVEGGMALALGTALFHGVNPRVAFLIGEGLFFVWWMCGIYTGLIRQNLQRKYHLQNSPCDPCLVHCCMHWCALCQEHREMQGHLSEDAAMPMTTVNPPPPQEMVSDDRNSGSSNDQQNNEEAQLEIIFLYFHFLFLQKVVISEIK